MGGGHAGIPALLQKMDNRLGIGVRKDGGILPSTEILGSKEDGLSTSNIREI